MAKKCANPGCQDEGVYRIMLIGMLKMVSVCKACKKEYAEGRIRLVAGKATDNSKGNRSGKA